MGLGVETPKPGEITSPRPSRTRPVVQSLSPEEETSRMGLRVEPADDLKRTLKAALRGSSGVTALGFSP